MKEDISSAIIESMSDGLIVLNFHGHITHMNPAASKLLGIKMEDTMTSLMQSFSWMNQETMPLTISFWTVFKSGKPGSMEKCLLIEKMGNVSIWP